MPLTDTRLRALKPKDKPYKVTDERGLYVEVTPTGSKLWRFRYRIGGAQKKLCIGSYPDISLKQARDEAYEARRAVASGGDPAFEKRTRFCTITMLVALRKALASQTTGSFPILLLATRTAQWLGRSLLLPNRAKAQWLIFGEAKTVKSLHYLRAQPESAAHCESVC